MNGGPVFIENINSFTITNCILWDNSATTSGGEILSQDDPPTVTYSDVEGGRTVASGCTTDATGNMNEDPLFVNAPIGNFRLSTGSPCINQGDNTALPIDGVDLDNDGDTTESIPFDPDGNLRVIDATVDIGAYEVQP